MIFSTSTRLSRAIVETKEGKNSALEVTAESKEGTLVEYGIYEEEAMQNCLKIVTNLAEAAITKDPKLQLSGELFEERMSGGMGQAAKSIAEFQTIASKAIEQFSHLRFETTQSSGTRSTTLRMPLSP